MSAVGAVGPTRTPKADRCLANCTAVLRLLIFWSISILGKMAGSLSKVFERSMLCMWDSIRDTGHREDPHTVGVVSPSCLQQTIWT